MMGGVAGLAGAWVAGPRKGRFDANGKPVTMHGHNAVLYMAGVLLLWFGFYVSHSLGVVMPPVHKSVMTACVHMRNMAQQSGLVVSADIMVVLLPVNMLRLGLSLQGFNPGTMGMLIAPDGSSFSGVCVPTHILLLSDDPLWLVLLCSFLLALCSSQT